MCGRNAVRGLYNESKMMKTIQDFRDRRIARPTKEALANAFTFLEGAPAEDHGLRKQVLCKAQTGALLIEPRK